VRRRSVVLAVGCVMAAILMFTGSASAAIVVGSNCGASVGDTSTVISLKSPVGYPLPSAIPSAGVITSWSFGLDVVLTPEDQVDEQLKVFAPTDVPNQFKVIGETQLSAMGSGTNTNLTRIPVQGGDLLGSAAVINSGSGPQQGALFCETKNAGDEVGEFPNEDPTTGATASITAVRTGFQNPIAVTVEPDADGDGYGDETQDQCPTDASTHEACPTSSSPPPKTRSTQAPQSAPSTQATPSTQIALSASAAAKKTFLTVSLTTTAQASVTVSGTVKIGKGKSVKLSGNTQIVGPGALAKFTVLFPAKLKAALKKLPTSKKLTINLSATAPGTTTKTLTVKVPGQMKPAKKHHVN
jgi:hypothetical protein